MPQIILDISTDDNAVLQEVVNNINGKTGTLTVSDYLLNVITPTIKFAHGQSRQKDIQLVLNSTEHKAEFEALILAVKQTEEAKAAVILGEVVK